MRHQEFKVWPSTTSDEISFCGILGGLVFLGGTRDAVSFPTSLMQVLLFRRVLQPNPAFFEATSPKPKPHCMQRRPKAMAVQASSGDVAAGYGAGSLVLFRNRV